MSKTIGIVVPSLAAGGGVPSVARFLCETIERSDSFDYRLFSVPSSPRDTASVRLTSPRSWNRGPMIVERTWEGKTYEHVGAVLPELEFQRYRARPLLTRRLQECDLIQVIAGSSAWALVARDVDRPIALQVATLVSAERKEVLRQERGLVGIWRRIMTYVVSGLEAKAIRLADTVFVENEWMERTLAAMTGVNKVTLAPPGVDTAYFRPAENESGSNADYILSVGRFSDPRKNVRLLFEAYALLVRRRESAPDLVLAGENGPREEDWKLARRLKIDDRVHFCERVSKPRLARLYRHAAVFVLSSSEEGLGMVFLEAQASGIPVVATRTRGSESAVEHGVTGILSPVDDPRALTDSLEILLSDERKRRRMGRAARQRAETRFSLHSAGDRFLREYRRLVL